MDVCWDMTKDRPMKRWLYALVFLAVLLSGCADMDMSGFGYIGSAMQDSPKPKPRPASPPPADKPVAQLAQCRNHDTCPTP